MFLLKCESNLHDQSNCWDGSINFYLSVAFYKSTLNVVINNNLKGLCQCVEKIEVNEIVQIGVLNCFKDLI